MENIRSIFPLFFSLGIFLLLLNHANAEDRVYPWNNSNLSPIQQWRSAYFCLNHSILVKGNKCETNNTLDWKGWLSFENSTKVEAFCGGECYNQTKNVLSCIDEVHKHFKFGTGAPVSFVRDRINYSCSSKQAFNISYPKPNSATSLYGRLLLPLISTFVLIIATFTYVF